jgi:hypothetical protein
VWRHAQVSGFRLYQEHGVSYPFAVRSLPFAPGDTICGTLLSWADPALLAKKIEECDRIEGFTIGLYQRALVEVDMITDGNSGGEESTNKATAWIYFQAQPSNMFLEDKCANFPGGDWLSGSHVETS